jgi:uncharacterized repeat protein (TIGR03803 family)
MQQRVLTRALLALVLICMALMPGQTQTLSALHSFNSYPNGLGPTGGIAEGGDGNYYGIATGGGEYNGGIVYRMTPAGDYSVLHSFTGGADGSSPSIFFAARGSFFGVAGNTVFKITPAGKLTPIFVINGEISSLLFGKDGWLYGTLSYGGATFDGSVFRINPNGTGFTTLYSFNVFSTNGDNPNTLLQGPDGLLYGTALNGGPNHDGTLFRLDTTGAAFTVLTSFSGQSDGAYPTRLISSSNGTLYGSTQAGGANATGVLYRIGTDGQGYTKLRDFDASDYNDPHPLVFGPHQTLYGALGGDGRIDLGSLYSIHTDGSGFTTLHTFSGGDGSTPNGLIRSASGDLYGTTAGGGNGRGTIFSMSQSGTFQSLYAITGTDDGAGGMDVVAGSDGNVYGVTEAGGLYNAGTVFKQTPSGTTVTLYSFETQGANGVALGGYPTSAPILAGNGNLYGALVYSDTNYTGLIYRLTPGGQFSVLHRFDPPAGNMDGYQPNGLIQGHDGKLYGTAQHGGANDAGTVFSIEPNGTAFTVLTTFSGVGGRGQPAGPLLTGKDGNLYGTTQDLVYGTPADYGSIFKITTQGQLTTLYTFTDYTVAFNPMGALVQGRDGTLYGVCAFTGPTYNGYSAGYGSIFSASPDGSALTNLHTFTPFADGTLSLGLPFLGFALFQHYLALDRDGRLYGVAQYGGGNPSYGTLYRLRTNGSAFTVLTDFEVPDIGVDPLALTAGPNGVLYGVNSGGGDYGSGTIFELTP